MADYDKKDEVPKHIKTYHENLEKERKLIDTTDHHHRFAYEHATDKILKGKDGLIDIKLLNKDEHQKKFADEMADFYIDKALDYFNYKKPGEKLKDSVKLDIFQKDMLMKSYANVTRGQLTKIVAEEGERFTYDRFDSRYKEHFMRDIREQLSAVSMQHLKQEHLDDIVKYTGAKDMVDVKAMKVEDGARLLKHHHLAGGVLPKKDLDNIISWYAVKDKFRKNYVPPKKDEQKKAA
jgi:hypothetical protein